MIDNSVGRYADRVSNEIMNNVLDDDVTTTDGSSTEDSEESSSDDESRINEKREAATKIQSAFRGYRVRQEYKTRKFLEMALKIARKSQVK